METMTISRSEGTREEAVFLGPSESSGHETECETATARNRQGDGGEGEYLDSPFLSSPAFSDLLVFL